MIMIMTAACCWATKLFLNYLQSKLEILYEKAVFHIHLALKMLCEMIFGILEVNGQFVDILLFAPKIKQDMLEDIGGKLDISKG